MMSIMVTFWLFVAFFGVIGALRGWAKELLVIFSVILALFIVNVFVDFDKVDFIKPFSTWVNPLTPEIMENSTIEEGKTIFSSLPMGSQEELTTQFWVRAGLVIALTFFGYQTPRIASFLDRKTRSDQIQDVLFGGVLGAINGYMIMGTLWAYMHSAYYLFDAISSPVIGDKAWEMVNYLPPSMMGSGIGLFLAVGVSFLFVLVVFI